MLRVIGLAAVNGADHAIRWTLKQNSSGVPRRRRLSEVAGRFAPAQEAAQPLFHQRAQRGPLLGRTAFGLAHERVSNIYGCLHMGVHIATDEAGINE